MKKLKLAALLLGAALFTGLGVTSVSAEDTKCGVGKCGAEKKAAMKATKCGAEKKAAIKAMKCGAEKKAAIKAMKCGAEKKAAMEDAKSSGNK